VSSRLRLALLLLLSSTPVSAQSLELTPVQARGNVGDVLAVKVTVRLHAGQELLELVPHPLLPPPEGMRIVSTDTLRPGNDQTWTGTIRMAFYRIGKQPVPTLGLLYRAEPGALPDTLVQAPLSIEIVPLLPAGNPSLKDIKPLERLGGSVFLPMALLALVVIAAGAWLFRRRAGVAPLWTRRAPAQPPLTSYAAGLAQLDALERQVVADPGTVVPAYAAVAEIVRGALLSAGVVAHPGLTTGELRLQLPIELADEGAGDVCAALLTDADLVKFARLHPDLAAARAQIQRARLLLTGWDHRTAPLAEAA
jgi:hypothetical protein